MVLLVPQCWLEHIPGYPWFVAADGWYLPSSKGWLLWMVRTTNQCLSRHMDAVFELIFRSGIEVVVPKSVHPIIILQNRNFY